MNLNDLIKSTEDKLLNPDLTLGTRRREEAILHHLTNLERTVTELVSQNTELYVDLCEMGEMARAGHTMNRHNLPEGEPKTERVHLYTDDTETQQFFLGGHKFYELTIDKMIRHKWPEEKPEKSNSYLIMNHGGAFHTFHYFLETEELEEGWYAYQGYNLKEVVKYWWNLPEVTE